VKADELRFGERPETQVRFGGSPNRRSVSRSERVNLPERVEANEDYRDVWIGYTLATGLTGQSDEPPARPGQGPGSGPDPGPDPGAGAGSEAPDEGEEPDDDNRRRGSGC
jgi:hypothetical protein